MRRLPEIVLVATSLAALFVLAFLIPTLFRSSLLVSGWESSWELNKWLALHVAALPAGRLSFLPFGALLGWFAAGTVGAFGLRLAHRHRAPAGLLLALALALLAGTVLGETLRLGRALDPALASDGWEPDGRLLAFSVAPDSLGVRLALGLGLPAGFALGVLLAVPGTGLPPTRLPDGGAWLRRLGAVGLLLAVASLAWGVRRSMDLPGPLDGPWFEKQIRRLDGLSDDVGRFLGLWIVGTLGFLLGWLRETGFLRGPAAAGETEARPFAFGPVDAVRWILLPVAVVTTAATAGFLDELRLLYGLLLGSLCVWAMTLLGEPGKGRFPRRFVPGASFVAGFTGVVFLLASLVLAFANSPATPPAASPLFMSGDAIISGTWPAGKKVLGPLATGANTALFGCLAAGLLPLLALVGERRRRR